MAITYSFITRWETSATIDTVWEVIQDSVNWPRWWPDFKQVKEVRSGSADGTGSVRRYTLRSPMGYTLTFDLEVTKVTAHNIITGKASGELEGTGTWLMVRQGDTTFIECHWNVSTTKTWMNRLAFALKPVFTYCHIHVMKNGARYLSAKLKTEVRVVG